jgi:hypothetical protein
MKISEQFVSNYLRAADLPQPRVLTIQTVTHEKMPEGDHKPVMRFVGEQQQLVLNKTNAFTCMELFGDETNAWHGRLIELYSTTTNFSGRMAPCIRMRAPQAAATPVQAVTHSPTQQQAVLHPLPQQQYVAPPPTQPLMQPQAMVQPAPLPVAPPPQQQHAAPPMQAPSADFPVDA